MRPIDQSFPYNNNGTKIDYTVKEVAVPTGYGVSYGQIVEDNDGNGTLEVVNSYPSTSRTVTKIWDDYNNQDRMRPDSVQVQLLYDGNVYDFSQSIRKCNIIIHRASHHPLKSQMAIHDSIPIIKECNHKSFPLTEDRILFLQE